MTKPLKNNGQATNAARQARFRASRRKAGLQAITVFVPRLYTDDFQAAAAAMVDAVAKGIDAVEFLVYYRDSGGRVRLLKQI